MDAFTLITRLCCPEAKGNAIPWPECDSSLFRIPKGTKKTSLRITTCHRTPVLEAPPRQRVCDTQKSVAEMISDASCITHGQIPPRAVYQQTSCDMSIYIHIYIYTQGKVHQCYQAYSSVGTSPNGHQVASDALYEVITPIQ